ncbi:complement C4 [Megalops cyprinoides]|uniref:complement C4 n=1 Tax=Megalops cyprinoides TaxID=118141 RepID=UPI00186469E9|nr:complement C4 [Megalops cyprinoides]
MKMAKLSIQMELSLILIISALLATSAQKPLYLITAPNIVQLDVDETVAIQLHEATKPVTVTLFFKHQTADMTVSKQETVVLNAGNNYQEVVKLKVDPALYKNAREKKRQRESSTHYVQLVAESPDLHGTKTQNIILSTRKGYIFIQTNKPIYNPGEIANFRVFTLDNYMMPKDEAIALRIFNSKGLMIYKRTVQSKQILQDHVAIPDVEQAGHWKIVASFLNSHSQTASNTTVEFEVREYVLPSFEVKIEPAQPYYVLKEESFDFNVSARYTYGKGVHGIAYVRFAVIDEQGNKTFLPGIEVQTAIQDGSAALTLLTKDLREQAQNRSINLDNCRLYIAVTALETASGELEEAESSTVKIVTTPYTIDLSKTKQYFTPEGMFSILATATFPDGTPAPHLQMRATVRVNELAEESIVLQGSGNNAGDAVFTFKVPQLAKSLHIKVFAQGEDQDVVRSDAHMSATATSSQSGSYLSVEVPHLILEQGQEMTVTFRDITHPGSERPSHIYYMILSKGKVVQVNRVARTDVTSVSLPFSHDLVPAFRVVAYYYINHQGAPKIVADSVWVDVQDVCKGQLEVLPFQPEYTPGSKIDVMVRADKGRVALAAVDTAVYIVNKQNKLTAQKMFDYMNSYDLGCSIGGGKNHESVFKDAGLTYLGSSTMAPKIDYTCDGRKSRTKRSYTHFQEFSAIVNRYGPSSAERKCCNDGAKLNMRLSCEQRHAKTLHQSAECRAAFLKCCKDATALREKIRRSKKKYSLARSESDEEEDAIDETNIKLRSHFPQTWMWETVNVGTSGLVRHPVTLPDSITTWEVQAIGMSTTNGFCIAEPKPLKVFQDFFVSVKLPYSVKRNEQLEVKAVVYNYGPELLQVTVKMTSVDGLCSAGGDKDKQVVSVPGNSAVPVYFVVVPLIIGDIPIQVTAYTSMKTADRIEKKLKVVGEGELVSVHQEHNIDGRNAKQLDIHIPAPSDAVPDGESNTLMSIKGGVMGQSAENCLNLEGVEKLITLPTGCAEQTMTKMSPAVRAMLYLDATNQWLNLNPDRRNEAKDMIQKGYNRILTHKNADGSYGSFSNAARSVWLTAFVAKELTRSREIITVQDSYIQESMSYLVSKQHATGAFSDPNPFYSGHLQGSGGGIDGEASLTAFVLVTMHHTLPVYPLGEGTELRMAMVKAQQYLEQKLGSLKRPFAVAITAYALSLSMPQSPTAKLAHAKLREIAICDREKGICHWADEENPEGEKKARSVTQANSGSVEMTSYALLEALLGEDRSYSTSIARWLTEQRQYGGGFRSTQDTVVALEALSEYSIQDNDVQDLDLNVEVCLERGRRERLLITKRNALTQPAIQVIGGSVVSVSTLGVGKGTVSLVHTYRTMKRADSYCDYFHLNISLEGEVKYEKRLDDLELDDYYNYETGEVGEAQEEPLSRVEWFDLRTRRKRHAPEIPTRESTLIYTVCLRTNGMNSTGMAIVDISLLSGLEPNMQDLEDHVKGTEKYIDHYDLGPNKVYLYFNKITDSMECVTFRATQITPIGLVQPAGAVIYDYYNPERRCSVFYSAPQKSNMISKLCSEDVCACAEGGCPKTIVTFSKNMGADTRNSYACFSPIVDYVYLVKVLKQTDDGVFTYYTMLVTKVLQIHKDNAIMRNAVREMIVRKSCSFNMKLNKEYLMMGKKSTITHTTDDNQQPRYILNNDMWIEEIPEEGKCKATKNRRACQLLKDFIQQYELNQCAL